jgi:hypothetical protein
MNKKALITGVTGQDGAYLSRFLLNQGYHVYGLLARRASDTQWRLRDLGIEREVDLREGDLTDLSSLTRLLAAIDVDEVYNLGAQSFVATSWMQPVLTGLTTGMGAQQLPELYARPCKFQPCHLRSDFPSYEDPSHFWSGSPRAFFARHLFCPGEDLSAWNNCALNAKPSSISSDGRRAHRDGRHS